MLVLLEVLVFLLGTVAILSDIRGDEEGAWPASGRRPTIWEGFVLPMVVWEAIAHLPWFLLRVLQL